WRSTSRPAPSGGAPGSTARWSRSAAGSSRSPAPACAGWAEAGPPARTTLCGMARDPDDGDAYVFDLVEDDAPTDAAGDAEPAADPDAGAGADPGVPPGAVPPSDPGRFRRLALPVAAVLAVALGTGVAVDGLRDDARRERMRDVPGGVADLSSPLAEDWAWSGVVGPGDSPTDAAVLGDVLAVRSDDGLVALGPGSAEGRGG